MIDLNKAFAYILGLLQIILILLGTWNLKTTSNNTSRLVRVETLLVESALSDLRDLKNRVKYIEQRCKKIYE